MDLAWIERKKEVREIRRPRRLLTITRHIVPRFVRGARTRERERERERGADVTCTTCKRYIEKNMVARARLHFPASSAHQPSRARQADVQKASCMVCWWKQIGQLGATRPRGKPSEGRSVACSCCLALLFFDIQPSLPTEPRALSLSEKSCIVRIASPFEHRSKKPFAHSSECVRFFFLSLSFFLSLFLSNRFVLSRVEGFLLKHIESTVHRWKEMFRGIFFARIAYPLILF